MDSDPAETSVWVTWSCKTQPHTPAFVTVYDGPGLSGHRPIAMIPITDVVPYDAALKIGHRISACHELAGGTPEAIDLRPRRACR